MKRLETAVIPNEKCLLKWRVTMVDAHDASHVKEDKEMPEASKSVPFRGIRSNKWSA